MEILRKYSELAVWPFSIAWKKAPLLVLLTIYVLVALIQWSIETYSSKNHHSNNHIEVNQFGNGSVCVPSGNNHPLQ